jgi:hypothetical protein
MNTFKTENLHDSVCAVQSVSSIQTKNSGQYVFYNLKGECDVETSIYRSAITDIQRLLCLAPAKSLSPELLITASNDDSTFKAEETIEGTMINLFWDERVGWEIATKKSVGCNYFYFRNQYDGVGEQKTFRQMFLEAFSQKPSELSELDVLSQLDKTCCYTFVLQHPLNHIVLSVSEPTVYLVFMYKLGEPMNYEYVSNYGEMRNSLINAGVKFPSQYGGVFSKQDFQAKYDELVSRNTESPGFMITNLKTGHRTSIESTEYSSIRALRGNNPNLFFQYLMLRKSGEVAKFIGHFPQYTKLFQDFQTRFNEYVSKLYHLYVDVFITKVKDPKSIEDKKAFFFVNRLHYTVYVPSLKTNKTKITPKIVEAFLDNKEYMMPI